VMDRMPKNDRKGDLKANREFKGYIVSHLRRISCTSSQRLIL